MAANDEDILTQMAESTDSETEQVTEKLEETLGRSVATDDGDATITPTDAPTDDDDDTVPTEDDDINLTTEEYVPDDTDTVDDDDDTIDDDDDDEPTGGGFDIQATLKEIKGTRTGNLRKAYLSVKAEKQHLEQEQGKLQQQVEDQEKQIDELNTLAKTNKVRVPDMNIDSHEPYKVLADKYKKSLTRAYNTMRSSKTKKSIRDQHDKYRRQLVDIMGMEGDKFDEARQEFDSQIEDTFGSDAEKATAFFETAADIDNQATEVRNAFTKDVDTNSRAYQRKVHTGYKKDMQEMLTSFYQLPDNQIEENPFTLRAYVTGLSQGGDGKKLRGYAKSDLDKVTQLTGGIAPFDTNDPKWQGMDDNVARDQWVEEFDKVEKQRQGLMPELMMEGIMQRRIVPSLIRRIRQLEKKRVRTPQPKGGKSGSTSPRKPKDAKEELTVASKELDAALANLGS